MDLIVVTQYVSMAIPLVTFIALAVSVFIFVRSKGTIDALKEAANTYRLLSEAKDAETESLKEKIDSLEAQIIELKKTIEVQREALSVAVDEFLRQVKSMDGANHGH